MKVKIWLGVLSLVLLGFISGVITTVLVARNQIPRSFMNEDTMLRSMILNRTQTILDLPAEERQPLDHFLSEAILSLRLKRLSFEADIGRTVLGGIQTFVKKRPVDRQEQYERIMIERYAARRGPIRGSLFLDLKLSIEQIIAVEDILQRVEDIRPDAYSHVSDMMYAVVASNKEHIRTILTEKQKDAFSVWLEGKGSVL